MKDLLRRIVLAPKRLLTKGLRLRKYKLRGTMIYIDQKEVDTSKNKAYGDRE